MDGWNKPRWVKSPLCSGGFGASGTPLCAGDGLALRGRRWSWFRISWVMGLWGYDQAWCWFPSPQVMVAPGCESQISPLLVPGTPRAAAFGVLAELCRFLRA